MEEICTDISDFLSLKLKDQALRLITDAPWYVPNAIIRCD
jgi:hypothetical protein